MARLPESDQCIKMGYFNGIIYIFFNIETEDFLCFYGFSYVTFSFFFFCQKMFKIKYRYGPSAVTATFLDLRVLTF